MDDAPGSGGWISFKTSEFFHVGHGLTVGFVETNRADGIFRIALAIDQLCSERSAVKALKRVTSFASLMNNPAGATMRGAAGMPS